MRFWWGVVLENRVQSKTIPLPSSLAGDAVRTDYLCKYENCSITAATIAVLIDRVVGMFALVALIIATAPLLFGIVDWIWRKT